MYKHRRVNQLRLQASPPSLVEPGQKHSLKSRLLAYPVFGLLEAKSLVEHQLYPHVLTRSDELPDENAAAGVRLGEVRAAHRSLGRHADDSLILHTFKEAVTAKCIFKRLP